ncbi:peptidoglycan-binding domain-containing protein [Hoyosella altamirensis]|uniref:Peptidoglycan binding-like domain-containing protein n=1 Tax=Hoyosella altamirensis TaxID=616997 RepID=A0A839RVA4_9ACTN|nr:peptidoglycan-binding domain-containing protein [Hoyosella altamirensis]MBB3039803.1 hypothetical protein [Hoyosella altamirensis]
MRTIALERANEILTYIWSKRGLPYQYGGSGRPPGNGGDCSWFVMAVSAMLEGKRADTRYGSTETYRLARGEVLGAVRASSPAAVPADAILKIGLVHGGGGPNSHMSGTFMGVAFESRGAYRGVSGHVVGGTARHWNDALYRDWWYYPARVGDPTDPTRYPLPGGWFYGPREAPLNIVSGEVGEPKPWIDGIKLLQARLNVPQTGRWRDARPAIIAAQQGQQGITPDGTVGPKTWSLILGRTEAPAPPEPTQPAPVIPPNATLNTLVQSLVPGSTTRAPLGEFVLTADLHAHETRKLVEQLLGHVAAIEARLASGGDNAESA